MGDRFGAVVYEAHRLIESAGGGLGLGDGEENRAETGIGFGEADGFGEQRLPCPVAAQAGRDVHAPDVTFVPAFFAGIAVVTGGAGEPGFVEGADDEVGRGGVGEALGYRFDGDFGMFGGGFAERLGNGGEGFQAEVPESGRIISGEEADRKHRLFRVS